MGHNGFIDLQLRHVSCGAPFFVQLVHQPGDVGGVALGALAATLLLLLLLLVVSFSAPPGGSGTLWREWNIVVFCFFNV